MLFTRRRNILGLCLLSLGFVQAVAPADDPQAAGKDGKSADKSKVPDRRLEVVPPAFVPLHPRSSEDQNRIEALRLYAAARGLEDRHKLTDALDLLEQARKLDPDATPILRRLSRINFVLGRTDQAVAVARKIIELDPGDTATLTLLIGHYLERKNDPAAAENLLRKVAENPKLDKSSPGYFLIQRNLGDIYADHLDKPEKAADAYARLMEALDERAANALSPRDKLRVIEGDEASAYLKFGEVFLKAKRYPLAIQAFRRGLLYKADHPVLPRALAEALVKSGKPDEALAVLEPYLKRQPAGSEPYELLADILKDTGKSKEILPRLEAAAQADPKNLRLQFLLAERYREEGQAAKADELLSELLKNQAEPQVYAALAQSYLKEKKFEELLKTLGDALGKPGGVNAVKTTLEALGDDPAQAEQALDAGLKLMEARPPRLSDESRKVLAFVGGRAKKLDKLIAIDRAAVKAAPTGQNYRELANDLLNAKNYAEGADVIEEMLVKHPTEKNGQTMIILSDAQFRSGRMAAAVKAARDALKLEPNNANAMLWLGFALSQAGDEDEAIGLYETVLKRFPNDEDIVKRARMSLSTSYVNKGDNVKGEAELETLLEKYPDDPGVNNDLGYLYADQGKNLEKAEAMIRKAIEEEPENSAYLDSLGWVLFKRGKAKEALEPLEKAAKGERLDVTICEHLGDVLFRLQNYARAKEYWTKAEDFAAKSSPPSKRLAEIRKKLSELDKLGPAPKPASGEGP